MGALANRVRPWLMQTDEALNVPGERELVVRAGLLGPAVRSREEAIRRARARAVASDRRRIAVPEALPSPRHGGLAPVLRAMRSLAVPTRAVVGLPGRATAVSLAQARVVEAVAALGVRQ